jgi:hypothetical protein
MKPRLHYYQNSENKMLLGQLDTGVWFDFPVDHIKGLMKDTNIILTDTDRELVVTPQTMDVIWQHRVLEPIGFEAYARQYMEATSKKVSNVEKDKTYVVYNSLMGQRMKFFIKDIVEIDEDAEMIICQDGTEHHLSHDPETFEVVKTLISME